MHAANVAPPLLECFIDRYSEAFNAQIGSFVDSLEAGSPVEVGFKGGPRALMLAKAAIKSVAEGRVVRMEAIG